MSRSLVSAILLAGVAPCVAQAQPAADPDKEPQEIVVVGEKAATVATSGTKTDTLISQTPQSISVIDSGVIADLGLQNLNQALRFVAGVTPETRGASAEVYDQFKLRGFDAPVFLDGLKQFGSGSGYANAQVDVSRLDRIEVLKGPSSALYGQSGPGGLVAQSSKLPLDSQMYGAVAATYGTYNLYRVDADVGGRVAPGVLVRVYGSVNGADSQQTYGRRERETISGAVTLGAGSRITLTLLGNYSHDPRNGNYGVFPTVGTFFPNTRGQIPTTFYGGEPNDFFKRDQAAGTYILRHDFGGGWAFRASGRYQHVQSQLGIVYTGGSPTEAGTGPALYGRFSYATVEHLNNWTYDNQLTGKFDTGPLQHQVMIGYDRQVAHSDELYTFGGGTNINVFAPVYGTMPTPSDPAHVYNYDGTCCSTPTDTVIKSRQQGVYAQDQIAVGGLSVTLSGRHDWAHQQSAGQQQDDRKFTGRAAALYVTPIGLNPYVSYSTSFEPQAVALQDGTLAKPSIGKQIEAGAKYSVPGTNLLLTGAYFHIEQTNVISYTPLFLPTQSGKVRSQGVEVEARGSLPYDFNVALAFSRQSVKVLADAVASKIGLGLATVGRGGTSANLEWAPKSGRAAGLVIGGAIRHVDSVYADQDAAGVAYSTPGYIVVDALARYDLARIGLRGFTLGINATNLFDKKYLTSCFVNYSWCWYGNRRTVQGTIGFHW